MRRPFRAPIRESRFRSANRATSLQRSRSRPPNALTGHPPPPNRRQIPSKMLRHRVIRRHPQVVQHSDAERLM